MIELKVSLSTTKDPNKVRETLRSLIGNEDFGVSVQCVINSNRAGSGLVHITDMNNDPSEKKQPSEIAKIAINIVRTLYKHEEITLIEVLKMPNEDEDSECFIYNYINDINPNNDNYIPIKLK